MNAPAKRTKPSATIAERVCWALFLAVVFGFAISWHKLDHDDRIAAAIIIGVTFFVPLLVITCIARCDSKAVTAVSNRTRRTRIRVPARAYS